jgi:hypothetical protein
MITTPKNILPIVAWSTLAGNVKQVSAWDYTITTHPLNIAEPGAGIKVVNDYFVANWGGIYSITGVSGSDLTVHDDFETGIPPTTGFAGIVFRSIGDGKSQWMPPIRYEILDRSARSYIETINLEVLWRNTANAKKVPFTSIDNPTIVNYQTTQVDPEDAAKTINYAEIYGEDPNVRCIIEVDAATSYQLQQMPQFTFIDGLLDTVTFYPGQGSINCHLIISKG